MYGKVELQLSVHVWPPQSTHKVLIAWMNPIVYSGMSSQSHLQMTTLYARHHILIPEPPPPALDMSFTPLSTSTYFLNSGMRFN